MITLNMYAITHFLLTLLQEQMSVEKVQLRCMTTEQYSWLRPLYRKYIIIIIKVTANIMYSVDTVIGEINATVLLML